MAEERLSYTTTDLQSIPNNSLPKPQLKPANKSTSQLEINNYMNPSTNNKHNKYSNHNKHTKPPSLNTLNLTHYPSADSSRSSSSRSSSSPTFNNNNNNEKKVLYKFKSGETFVSFPYLIPQKIIGEGAYACVSSAMDTRTKKKYAIKKNRNAFVNIGDAKRILREIKLMYHFQGHPNLMSVIDVIPPDIGTQQKFKDVYLIMPKMHMTLSKLITKSTTGKIKLYECDIETIMYQICRGLEYMHSGGVIHRDIKPENILINCYFHNCNDPNCNIVNKNLWQVRITDFGLARGINDPIPQKNNGLFNNNISSNNNKKVLTEYVVTRYYRAPEVMCCSRLYSYQIDVWSLGCLFGEMYYKKALFRGNNHLHQLQVIFYYCGTPIDLDWVKMNDAKQWIKQLPKIEKKDFMKEFNIKSKTAADLLNKLLICNPKDRMSISSALRHPFFKNIYKAYEYKKCVPFDTTFEQEPILRTNFGVRHMMYEELLKIHKNCNKLLNK